MITQPLTPQQVEEMIRINNAKLEELKRNMQPVPPVQPSTTIQPQPNPIPVQPPMQGAYPQEPIPQPLQQGQTPYQQTQQAQTNYNEMVIPQRIAAIEVNKWLEWGKKYGIVSIVGYMTTAIIATFSSKMASVPAALFSILGIGYLFFIMKEIQRLKSKYSLR